MDWLAASVTTAGFEQQAVQAKKGGAGRCYWFYVGESDSITILHKCKCFSRLRISSESCKIPACRFVLAPAP
jgi:hypothetical protein